MGMFCYQCQETAKNTGCTMRGVCGKQEDTSNLMDLLIYLLKGISVYGEKSWERGNDESSAGLFIARCLFATITNANFDNARITALIKEALTVREEVKKRGGIIVYNTLPDCAVWYPVHDDELAGKAATVGIPADDNEDVRSLRQMLILGLKGIAAYADHAAILGYEDRDIYRFIMEGLASTVKKLPVEEMITMVMKTGDCAVRTMALLDRAHTSTYGNPGVTKVPLGVRNNPGILVSGHDLKDMEELLKQTEGSGVDVYTHGEMLPAHYYPAFKKYGHLAGNYGGSWWKQKEEFASFNGPVLMTTNCIVPPGDSCRDRIYTTGMAGYPGITHIADRELGGRKDFSEIIALAKKCAPPSEIESGEITGGFAHHQVGLLADKVVEGVKNGNIKRFVVMGGCDGRMKSRDYYTEVAKNLPADTIILTAGCAKYRYNKLPLGDIGGIPRVLDAGQCNDSYSLVMTAIKLREAFGLEDINELPVSYDIAWYEQKAVEVLLALLSLGVKGIRLGPTLPAFVSPGVLKVLVEKFDIKPSGNAADDVRLMMEGK